MKKILLAGLCLLLTAPCWAQNRTLGIGVSTPNPNAALHVESPTANQGVILPRLTTSQRLDALFTGALGDVDNGLMVYDTDLSTLFIWNGSTWQSTAEVVGAGSFRKFDPEDEEPALWVETMGPGTALVAKTASAPTTIDAENSNTENGFAGLFKNTEQTNSFPAIQASTMGPAPGLRIAQGEDSQGSGIDVSIENANETAFGLNVIQMGHGPAASLSILNPESNSHGVRVYTNGVSDAALMEIDSESSFAAAVRGRVVNTGGSAALFEVENPDNSNTALQVTHYGYGSAATFEVLSEMGETPAVIVHTNGIGTALDVTAQGGGTAVFGRSESESGSGGLFVASHQENSSAAVEATHYGAGEAVRAEKWSSTGHAGFFRITDQANSESALYVETTGTGTALEAITTTGIAAVSGMQSGPQGHSALFESVSQGNSLAAVQVNMQGTGAALALDHQNNGIAIDIQSGALKYSVAEITTPGLISVIAGLYKITATGTFTLPTSVPEGTVCKVYNGTTENVTINDIYTLGVQSPLSIVAGNLEDLIFIDGAWYRAP